MTGRSYVRQTTAVVDKTDISLYLYISQSRKLVTQLLLGSQLSVYITSIETSLSYTDLQ